MPRKRYIKPEFFKNEELADCSALARLLFAGLWCWADAQGRLEERPRKLKAEILPYDNCDIRVLLDELVSKRFVRRYEANGRKCLSVTTFDRHQKPHQNEPIDPLLSPLLTQPSDTLAKKSEALGANSDALGAERMPLAEVGPLTLTSTLTLTLPSEEMGDESPMPPLARSCEDAASEPAAADAEKPVKKKRPRKERSKPPPDESAPVLWFPVVGDPEALEWALREAKLAQYQDTFRGMDVLAECKKARQWCLDNPGRRKTPDGMTRFLGTWLGKAQNSGRFVPRGGQAQSAAPFESNVQRLARLRKEAEQCPLGTQNGPTATPPLSA